MSRGPRVPNVAELKRVGRFRSYTKGELADAVRRARDILEVGSSRSVSATSLVDLNEKLEAVQHFFEVKNGIPDRVRRPSSYAEELAQELEGT